MDHEFIKNYDAGGAPYYFEGFDSVIFIIDSRLFLSSHPFLFREGFFAEFISQTWNNPYS
jgi:hypothetical protein